ncbi:toxin-antitoxin system YwqK family antitoxin [Haloferula sp.]|uniref:toxin-antitoxin system YwqK family antitoxin n=1 Tax=Haloferula sp. TaxID=2497595 RepID=UPI00329D77E1
MKILPVFIVGVILLAGCRESNDTSERIPDAEAPELIANALPFHQIQVREKLFYAPNTQSPYSGWVKYMWDNGQVQMLKYVKDGVATGPTTSWYESGEKKAEGRVKNNFDDGLVVFWHRNGQKAAERTYDEGNPVGLWQEWFDNGQKMSERRYSESGEKVGIWREWYKNGKLAREGARRYQHGK